MANQNPNNNSYWMTLHQHLLTRKNFPDREKCLELVLSMESGNNILAKSIPQVSGEGANNLIIRPRQERYEISEKLYLCKQAPDEPVGAHVLKIIGYFERLENIGCPLREEVKTDIVLQSLDKWFSPFISNYLMDGIEVTLPELWDLLISYEDNNKRPAVTHILMDEDEKSKYEAKDKKWKSSKSKSKAKKTLKQKGMCHRRRIAFIMGNRVLGRLSARLILLNKRLRGKGLSHSGILL